MSNPPGFDPKGAAAFTNPLLSEPRQEWLTPSGALRQDLETQHNVAQFEAGALKFAMGQGQVLFQTLFFLWISGTQLSLFSLIFLSQGGSGPFLSIMNVNKGEKSAQSPLLSPAYYWPLPLPLSFGGLLPEQPVPYSAAPTTPPHTHHLRLSCAQCSPPFLSQE